MDTNDHLKQIIGSYVVQLAQAMALIDELQAKIPKPRKGHSNANPDKPNPT